MDALAISRPVFHSESDLQFAFAQALDRLDPTLDIRLEVRLPGSRRRSVDLVCTGDVRSLIEFKYPTAHWAGTDGLRPEAFSPRHHAAMDLARYGFLADVSRLEGAVNPPDTNGFAVLVTNDVSLWQPPRRPETRDRAYRLHEGAHLSGALIWGRGDFPSHDLSLRGSYSCTWHDYSSLPGRNGRFRWLGWPVS